MGTEFTFPPLYAEHEDTLLGLEWKVALACRLVERDKAALDEADWLAGTIFFYDGPLFDHRGVRIEITDDLIDKAFDFEDAFEWLDEVKRFVETAPRRRSQKRLLLRLTLLDLAFKIIGKPIQVS